MPVKRDPVIVAPDQMHPDEWMAGDMTFLCLGGVLYELTVKSTAAPLGLDFSYTKGSAKCDKQIAAYHARLKAKAPPDEDRINAIWDAVVGSSKQ